MLQLRFVPAFSLALASLPLVALAASAQGMSTAERQALQQACGPEVRQLCAGVAPGGGRIMDCVKSKKDQLSETCTAALSKAKAEKRD